MIKRQKLLFPELLPATQIQSENQRPGDHKLVKSNLIQLSSPPCVPLGHVAVLDFYCKLLSRIDLVNQSHIDTEFIPYYVAFEPPPCDISIEPICEIDSLIRDLHIPHSKIPKVPTVHVGRVTRGIWNDPYLMHQLTKF